MAAWSTDIGTNTTVERSTNICLFSRCHLSPIPSEAILHTRVALSQTHSGPYPTPAKLQQNHDDAKNESPKAADQAISQSR
jgi:hypothetical protein